MAKEGQNLKSKSNSCNKNTEILDIQGYVIKIAHLMVEIIKKKKSVFMQVKGDNYHRSMMDFYFIFFRNIIQCCCMRPTVSFSPL